MPKFNSNSKFYLLSVFCTLIFCINICRAQVPPTSPSPFVPPSILRPRVEFWKAVFTRYGKNQIVIHHRDFPQVVFKVLDFSRAAEQLGPIALQKYKEKISDAQVSQIKQILLALSRGEMPDGELPKRIVSAMNFLPGGSAKYKRAVDDDLVRTQTGIREKYAEAIARASRHLPEIERIFVNDYKLPVELTRLPYIESSFDYTAYSAVGAAGIWQFMPRTGRVYMSVGTLVDERRDPITATRAAARYLSSAFAVLGTWPLAVTSYNHGVAGVSRKVREYGSSDLASILEDPNKRVFGFASTNFYPEFLAAIEVHAARSSIFPEVQLQPALETREVRMLGSLSVESVVSQIGLPVEELQETNRALSASIWSGKSRIPAGYLLRLPVKYEAQIPKLRFAEIGPVHQTSVNSSVVGSGIVYTVRKGDTLLSVAKKYQTTVARIKADNKINSMSIAVGAKLIIRQEHPPAPAQQRHVKKTQSASSLKTKKKQAPKSSVKITKSTKKKSSKSP